jgi:meiotically up-regulated gene 157 (Mug157) protein
MRTLAMVLGTSLLTMAALAYWLGQQAQQQEQLAGDLARQVERLLDEIESATRQRVEYERNLARLTDELVRARTGTVSSGRSPAAPTDETEAAFRARETALRERLEREYRERLEAGSRSQATAECARQ